MVRLGELLLSLSSSSISDLNSTLTRLLVRICQLSTVAAFALLPLLSSLTFQSPLIIGSALEEALGCERCAEKSTEKDPQVQSDCQLVGGPGAIWDAEREVNFARLELLSNALQVGTEVHWRILSPESSWECEDIWLVHFDGVVREGEEGRKLLEEEFGDELVKKKGVILCRL